MVPFATSARPGHDHSRRDASAPLRHLDVVLIVCSLALSAMGVLMVFSATRGGSNGTNTSYLYRDLAFSLLGAGVMAVVTMIDYRRFLGWVWVIYGASILTLIAVISPLGQRSKGAQAWFGFGPFQMQPAEFSKIALILATAVLLVEYAGEIDLRRLGVIFAVAGVPAALIMLQPDLGMVMIMVAIMLGMLLVGGLSARYIVIFTLVGIVGVVGVLNSSVLKQYQKDRLTAFINPGTDSQGTTYNVDQSQIAIANGSITGEGLFNGHQTQLQFVPEQQTDFIFTVVGEELGFIGSATVLTLYGIVIWRIWRTAQLARDNFGTLLCVGVLSMFVFQVFENIGMAMGITPVTGIPLPLMSYGGSSAITTAVAIGLVSSVHAHRFR